MSKFLYNGEKLPELPGWWDQVSFPNLFIYKAASGSTVGEGTYLVATDKLGYITHPTDESGAVIDDSFYFYTLGGSDLLEDQANPISFVRWKSNGTEWEQVEIDLISNIYAGYEVVWANTTLRDADGNVLLVGSDPVPAPTFFLKSWLTGFALGLAGKPLPLAIGNIMESIVGAASGLEYAFDQNSLRLDVTDTGVEGDSFSLVGNTLTVNLQEVIPYRSMWMGTHGEPIDAAITFSEFQELCWHFAVATVELDGEKYECVAKSVWLEDTSEEYCYIGNASQLIDIAHDTGEPFVLYWREGDPCMMFGSVEVEKDVSIRVYVGEAKIIHYYWGAESYPAKPGMTWVEFVNSAFNVNRFSLSPDGFVICQYDPELGDMLLGLYPPYDPDDPDSWVATGVCGDDLIVEGGNYSAY